LLEKPFILNTSCKTTQLTLSYAYLKSSFKIIPATHAVSHANHHSLQNISLLKESWLWWPNYTLLATSESLLVITFVKILKLTLSIDIGQ
jgi:hypothetical protein